MVNLRTGAVRNPNSNPAETGTLLLEFGTLSKLTGNPVYYNKAKRALVETYKRRSHLGLVGSAINVETGAWTDPDSHISGGIDSYYEYLWKCWLLFGDKDCRGCGRRAFPPSTDTSPTTLNGELWYGHANMQTGARTETTYGALDAFFPALLALSGDLDRARRLQASSFKMWNLHGIEPEVIDYKTMRVLARTYHLRPEIVESTYYLHHFTRDPQYQRMGEKIFDDFVRYCRTEVGYAALSDMVTKKKRDEMESFVLAETFKYFYLLFAPPRHAGFRQGRLQHRGASAATHMVRFASVCIFTLAGGAVWRGCRVAEPADAAFGLRPPARRHAGRRQYLSRPVRAFWDGAAQPGYRERALGNGLRLRILRSRQSSVSVLRI